MQTIRYNNKQQLTLDNENYYNREYNKENLFTVILPKMQKIPDYYLSGNNLVEKVIIPDGVKEIGSGTFACCESLKKVIFPNSVISINKDAFSWCTSLKEIYMPNSILEIDTYSFDECTSLEYAKVPQRFKYLEKLIFFNCSPNLKIEYY